MVGRKYTVVRKDKPESGFLVPFLKEEERLPPKDADSSATSPGARAICQHGVSVMIQCEADSQVISMYWYRQRPGQSLSLIATANQGSQATYESGFAKEKFPISRPSLNFSVLTVSSVSPEDSSSYFCSADTVLGPDHRSEQEPWLPPAGSHPAGPDIPGRLVEAGNRSSQADAAACVLHSELVVIRSEKLEIRTHTDFSDTKWKTYH
ncbi:T cell receptor beta variable 29-1 [Camelus dromedarius]|nr:T cell receptor beta variable 29-1 [Camelus dromedarius]